MNKTFAIACIASVALATSTKMMDAIANRQLSLGAPANSKINLAAVDVEAKLRAKKMQLAQQADAVETADQEAHHPFVALAQEEMGSCPDGDCDCDGGSCDGGSCDGGSDSEDDEPTEEDIRAFFKSYDSDNNGLLSVEELTTMAAELGVSDADRDHALAHFDGKEPSVGEFLDYINGTHEEGDGEPAALAQVVLKGLAQGRVKPDPYMAEKILAQTKARASAGAQGSHTCQSLHDLRTADVEDFWSLKNGTSKWTDPVFGPNEESLYWADLGETNPRWGSVTWSRAQDAFPGKSLFGAGASLDDVNQGAIGNCWFMAAASGVAEKEDRLQKMFLNTDDSLEANGVYGVNFYTLGVPHTVVVDDYLPMQWGTTKFARPGSDNSLWGAILEKAFAKHWGTYERLQGGLPHYAIRTLLGSPWEEYYKQSITVDDLWTKLAAADYAHDMIMTGTPGSGNHDNTHENGLAHSHAYTVVGVATLSTGDRLVKMRNPWGSERFTGDWSDSSSKWTAALRAEVDHVNADDGYFYMSVADYHDQTFATWFSKENEGWHSDYFLMLDDPGTGDNRTCRGSCSERKLKITSDVAQSVWVTLHTWDDRAAPRSCTSYASYHLMSSSDLRHSGGYTGWYHGSHPMAPKEIPAGGSVEITAYWNWNRDIPKDWSVTAWGADGPVHVELLDSDIQTAHMPVAPAQSGGTDPTPEPEPAPTPDPEP